MKTKKEIPTADRVANAIREAINYGKLKPGYKLKEREIKEEYKISQIPIREALKVLEGEGLLTYKGYAGYTIREVTPDEMIELFDLLKFLMVKLLDRAIPRYTEITYYQFKSIIAELEKTKEVDKCIDFILKFVDEAFQPAGLPFSCNLSKQILNKNIISFQGVINAVLNGKIQVTEFIHFIDLCQKHEIESAVKFTLEQLDSLIDMVIKFRSGNGD